MSARQLFTIILFLFSPLILWAAADMSVVPQTGFYRVGETFTATVVVSDPTTPVYTARVELRYPPNLLAITNFTPTDGWVLLEQTEYNKIDNVTGVLIKTGAYPTGFSSQKSIGTITFRVKASGNAVVTLEQSNLQVLDANSVNIIGRGAGAVYVLGEPVVASVATVTSPTANLPTFVEPTVPRVQQVYVAEQSNIDVLWFVISIFVCVMSLILGITIGRLTRRSETVVRHTVNELGLKSIDAVPGVVHRISGGETEKTVAEPTRPYQVSGVKTVPAVNITVIKKPTTPVSQPVNSAAGVDLIPGPVDEEYPNQ